MAGFAASLVGTLGALVPHPDSYNTAVLLIVQAISFVTCTALYLGARLIPRQLAVAIPASATLMTTAAVISSGGATSPFALFYLWTGLFTFYALDVRSAAIHVTFSVVNFVAVAGFFDAAMSEPIGLAAPSFATILIGTLLTTGTILAYLRSRLERSLADLDAASVIDNLTALPNRRGLVAAVEREVHRAEEAAANLALVVFDLDRFKLVNDNGGIGAGDVLLQQVAGSLREISGPLDLIWRTGGDEFAVLRPGVAVGEASALGEQIRRTLAELEPFPGSKLTASTGIAIFPDDATDCDNLIRHASEARLAAKLLGRDRSVVYSEGVRGVLESGAEARASNSPNHLQTVLSLAEALDLREGSTARHSEVVGRFAARIAAELGFEKARIERVRIAGQLHDVGKVAVPDSILCKPGPLDEAEWELMRRHPEHGARLLGASELADLREWVLAHHERPDGTGYPRGLDAAAIPIEAAILAVADAYEAMISDRVYRKAPGPAYARLTLLENRGTQFDPLVVDAFVRVIDRTASGDPAPSPAARNLPVASFGAPFAAA